MKFGDLYAEASRNGLTKPKKVRGEGFKFLNMGELFAHRRVSNVPMDRAPLTEKEKSRSILERYDLLFARQSMVAAGAGKCSVFLHDDEPVCFDSHLIRVRLDQRICNPLFAFYFFESPVGRELIHSITSQGAGVAGITGSNLQGLDVSFPPLVEQNEVAATLGALDDKIELNRKTTAALEEMARALYRSWFVDFDPVEAKAAGRAPVHMDAATAALFPDRFGPDGLPAGWTKASLLDLVTLISGGTPKTSIQEYWDGDISWASAKDVSQCRDAFLVETERTITRLGLENSSTKIIPRFATVVVARGATTGRACMFGNDFAMNQTCYALHSKRGQPFFANCLVMDAIPEIALSAHGSVFDTITTKTLQTATVNSPPVAIRQAFEREVSPMFHRILQVINESCTLATLRDALLPKLMSGELRVREAEHQIAEAV